MTDRLRDTVAALDDLEQLRRQLVDQEAAAVYRPGEVFVIPVCPDCGGPLGMASLGRRGGVGVPRCGSCVRARKQRRRASRQPKGAS